jgi:uncharacterized protein (TIGR02001 family)
MAKVRFLWLVVFAATAATTARPAEWAEDLSVSSVFGVASEYVFRGEKRAGASFQPGLEAGHPVGPGDAYGGVWINDEIGGDGTGDEIDFYAGYAAPVSRIVSVNAGATRYWYPDDDDGPGRETELFLGLSADLPFRPTIAAYYEFTYDRILVRADLRKRHELSQSFFLEAGLGAGTGRERDANGDGRPGSPSNGYWFGESRLDLVFEANRSMDVAVGVRYAGRDDGGFSGRFSWGGSVEIGF